MALLVILPNSNPQKITGCFYIDYSSSYDLQLICDNPNDPHQEERCFSHMLSDYYNWGSYVRLVRTGECRGSRLNRTIQNLFINLDTLDISNYGIDFLSPSDLFLGRLTNFNVSHNKLTKIPDQIFIHTPQIKDIDFSFNKINEVSLNDFKGASSLSSIHLSHNEISILKSGIFIRTPHIISLDFSFNHISIVENDLFSDLSELQFLNFNNNLITNIEKGTFKNNGKLTELHLENNPIKRLNFGIFSEFSTSIIIHGSWMNVTEIDASQIIVEQSVEIQMGPEQIRFTFDKNELEIVRFMGNFTDFTYFNISGNHMVNTLEVIDQLTPSIEIMDLSFNELNELNADQFERFENLKFLNLSNTWLAVIHDGEVPFLENSKQLRELHLQENPIERVDCNIFTPIKNSASVFITWENVNEIDSSCLGNTLKIDLDQVGPHHLPGEEIIFRVSKSTSSLRCTKNIIQNLTRLNLSGNQLQNTAQILNLLGPSVKILDIGNNFVGKLTAQTFERFENLLHLNLSRTNLSNFGFDTFYHQKRLQTLDLSYNFLHKVDFTLLLRNFKNLQQMNLEGNDLVEIDSVTLANFPVLKQLGISKNNFSCHYLATFLRQWHHLVLHYNPSKQTHIDGIDCVHSDRNDIAIGIPNTPNHDGNISTFVGAISDVVIRNETKNESLLIEMGILKYLVLLLCVVICGYMIFKSKIIQNVKRKFAVNSLNGAVVYQQGTKDNQRSINLLETESIHE